MSEYAVRQDILLALETNDLTDAQAQALYDAEEPLKIVLEAFERMETGHMDDVLSCLENTAEEMIRKRILADRAPLYRYPVDYAREHKELEAYRASFRANVACMEAIEAAIAENYSDNRLKLGCVKPLMDRFGADRMEYVLAVTVTMKSWDMRFSTDNRMWASLIPSIEDDNGSGDRRLRYTLNRAHPGLVNLFITAFRKVQQQEKQQPEKQEKASIYDRLRQPVAQPTAEKPGKDAARGDR